MKKLTKEQKERWAERKERPPLAAGLHKGARHKPFMTVEGDYKDDGWRCQNCGNKESKGNPFPFIRHKSRRICKQCGKINGG